MKTKPGDRQISKRDELQLRAKIDATLVDGLQNAGYTRIRGRRLLQDRLIVVLVEWLLEKAKTQKATITLEDAHGIGWHIRIGTIRIGYERMKPKAEKRARELGNELAGLLDTDIVVEIPTQDGRIEKRITMRVNKK